MKCLYKYPQRGVSRTRSSSRRTGAAAARGAGVRAARHRRLRRRPLLRRLRRVREGRPRRHLHPHRGRSTAGRRRRRSTSCRTSGSATPGPGARAAAPSPVIRRGPGGRRVRQPRRRRLAREPPAATCRSSTGSGTRYLYADRGRRAALHGQRDQRRRASTGRARRAASRYVKDAFHRHVVDGEDVRQPGAVGHQGVPALPARWCPPGGSVVLRLRLTTERLDDPLADVDAIVAAARRPRPTNSTPPSSPPSATADEKLRPAAGARRACCGRKQIYLFDVNAVARGRQSATAAAGVAQARSATPTGGTSTRCASCRCRTSGSTPGSRPGTWRSTASPLALVDPEFAKEQLWLLLFEQFQHPNGPDPRLRVGVLRPQPAGPRLGGLARLQHGPHTHRARRDREFLEKCFHKLLINFAWWVNKVDSEGNNVFEGGFLGLDNITVIDRSEQLPDGAMLEQSDATGWMGMFCLQPDAHRAGAGQGEPRSTRALATKFFQHYIYVGARHEEDGRPRLPALGRGGRLLLRRAALPRRQLRQVPRALAGRTDPALRRRAARGATGSSRSRSSAANLHWFLQQPARHRAATCCHTVERDGEQRARAARSSTSDRCSGCCSASATRRSSSRPSACAASRSTTRSTPSRFGEQRGRATSRRRRTSKIKGGNSNWRGPVWFPTTFLMIESLRKLGTAYGADVHGAGAGRTRPPMTLWRGGARTWPTGMIRHLHARRARPAARATATPRKFQEDPHWRDLHPLLRVLPRRHRRGPRGLAPDRLDGPRRLADRRVAAVSGEPPTAAAQNSTRSPRVKRLSLKLSLPNRYW